MALRDRIFQRSVASAMTSPSAMLLGAGAATVVIATGAPLWLAPIAGLAGWLTRVAPASKPVGPAPAARQRHPLDQVSHLWRPAVEDAMQARARLDAAPTPSGADARVRLQAVTDQVDEVIARTGDLARQGSRLSAARDLIDRASLERQLAAPALPAAAAEAIVAQIESADRLDASIGQVAEELVVVNAKLDELVAKSIELSAGGDVGGFSPIEGDLRHLTDELEAVRQATAELQTGS